jgi:hypothetical protein
MRVAVATWEQHEEAMPTRRQGHRERSLLLPTASACFNMLKLPAYPRFEVLEKKLLMAVRCGAEGFVFAVGST